MTMPALGESVTEGTVTRWLKAVGDEVTADEPLLEVSTDKVDTEIPAPVSGTLLSISVNEDETVDVGAELAIIGSGSAGGGVVRARRGAAAGGAGRGAEAGRRQPKPKQATAAGGAEAGGSHRQAAPKQEAPEAGRHPRPPAGRVRAER